MYRKGDSWWYKGKDGKYYNLGSKIAKARSREVEIKKQLDRRSSPILTERITVAELMEDWYFQKYCRANHAKTTLKSDRYFIKTIKEKLGHLFLAELVKGDILQAISERRNEGIGNSALRREWFPLKHALRLAEEDWELIEKSPMKSLRLPKPDSERVRYLLDEELPKLFEALDLPEFSWMKNAVVIAREIGIRRGDLIAHVWSEVDFNLLQTVIKTSKNGMTVMVPWSEDCLEAYHSLHKVRGLKTRRVIQRNGKPVNGNYLTKQFSKVVKAAGIVDFRWHDLRHDFISGLVQSGVEIYVVKHLAGHLDIRSTMMYAHLAPHQKCSAIEQRERGRKKSTRFYQTKKASA